MDTYRTLGIGQKSNPNPTTFQMGELVLVNPNSYVSVRAVLDSYKTLHGIGIDREWVFLGCDGPPYRLASIIIDENENDFDWVSLVPGPSSHEPIEDPL